MANENVGLINPLQLCLAIDKSLQDKSILIGDGGDFVATASYIIQPRGPYCWLDPGVFGTLGVGAGFAMGAKLARPDHDVWLLYGDGAAGDDASELYAGEWPAGRLTDQCALHGAARGRWP